MRLAGGRVLSRFIQLPLPLPPAGAEGFLGASNYTTSGDRAGSLRFVDYRVRASRQGHPSDTTLPASAASPPPYCDINDDNRCAPLDVLTVISFLNSHPPELAERESEALVFAAPFPPTPSPPNAIASYRMDASLPSVASRIPAKPSQGLSTDANETRDDRPAIIDVRRAPIRSSIAERHSLVGRTPLEEEFGHFDETLPELETILPGIAEDVTSVWRARGEQKQKSTFCADCATDRVPHYAWDNRPSRMLVSSDRG